jgi:glycosyltransferase involved in cell wall biosynthesis
MADGTLRLVYAGALTPTYEVDVAIRAAARLVETDPGLALEFAIYGRGDAEEGLRALATDLGIADRVSFRGRIPLEEVPAAVAAADIGIAPTRRDPFTEMSLSTKILEYAAMGKPAICSDLPMVAASLGSDAVWVYPSGDDAALARAITEIVDDREAREARVARAADAVVGMAWEREAETYRAVVDRLIDARDA